MCNEHRISVCIQSVLCCLAVPDAKPDIPEVIRPAVEYIAEHFREEVTLETLADLCHVSVTHLIRCFARYIGFRPHDYLQEQRLRHAKVLLTGSALSIEQIAEQSGFIADLGYETYQKILAQAVAELKNDEFAELFADSPQQTAQLSGEDFVDDCTVDCDLHAYLPEDYVPGSSERMLLYRELDSLTTDEQLAQFRQRLEDRFGPVPPEGEELLLISPLRRLGRRAGAERLALKQGRLTLYFVSRTDSPFYSSNVFGNILDYATTHYRTCQLRQDHDKRRMIVGNVKSVAAAVQLLQDMMQPAPAATPSA